jgi:hypothetical protein
LADQRDYELARSLLNPSFKAVLTFGLTPGVRQAVQVVKKNPGISVPFGDGGNPSPSGEGKIRVTWSRATLPTWSAHEERPEGARGLDSEVPEGRVDR